MPDKFLALDPTPLGTRNPRVFCSSEPTPEESLCGGGAQGGSGSNPPSWIPNRGVQGEPCTKRCWSTYYIRLGRVRLERLIIVFSYVDVTVKGRDECFSLEGRTQPRCIMPIFHRVYGVCGLLKKPPLPHRDGVGGLLKKTTELSRLPRQLKCSSWTSDLCERASSRGVEGAWLKARSPEKFTDVTEVMVLTRMVFCPSA